MIWAKQFRAEICKTCPRSFLFQILNHLRLTCATASCRTRIRPWFSAQNLMWLDLLPTLFNETLIETPSLIIFLRSAGPGLMCTLVKGHISVDILHCFLQHSSSPRREWPLEYGNLFAGVLNIADAPFAVLNSRLLSLHLNTHCKLGWIIPASVSDLSNREVLFSYWT